MATKRKASSPQADIIVGLPNLQDYIGMINRVSTASSDSEARQWYDLRELLSDLYTQLQHQDDVRVRRFGARGRAKPHLV